MLSKISSCAFLFVLLLHLSPAFPQERTKLGLVQRPRLLAMDRFGWPPRWAFSTARDWMSIW